MLQRIKNEEGKEGRIGKYVFFSFLRKTNMKLYVLFVRSGIWIIL